MLPNRSAGEFLNYLEDPRFHAQIANMKVYEDLVRLKLNMLRYRLEHGKLPNSLIYRGSALPDPFSSDGKQPYLYDAKSQTISSAGDSLKEQYHIRMKAPFAIQLK